MSNPLVFELVLDPAETVRAGQEIERRDPSWQSWRLWAFWLLIPLTMIVAFRWPIRALGAVLGAAIFGGLVALLTPALRRRRVRRAYAATPALAGPQRYEFTDDGLALSNASVSNLVRWSAFVQAAETPEFFLLYYSKRCAYYLPRRIMGPEAQIDALRELLRSRLGDRAAHVAPPT